MEPKVSEPKPEPTASSLAVERDNNIKFREVISILGMGVCTAYLHGIFTNEPRIAIPAGLGMFLTGIGTYITDTRATVAERKRLNILYNEGKK